MAAIATAGSDNKLVSGKGEAKGQQYFSSSAVANSNGSRRQDRQKVVPFVWEADKQRKLVEKLENEMVLSWRKNGWKDMIGEFEACNKSLEDERNLERENLEKQLTKIRNGVKKFRTHLFDVRSTPRDIAKLKETMSDVEIAINALKEEQRSRFEEYLKEERICRQEISAYERKFETWNLPIKINPKHITAPIYKTKISNSDLPGEVIALDLYLQKTGGTCGGWDQSDHRAFLRVWARHKGLASFKKEASVHLPGKTSAEIEQHECWYQGLLQLQDEKRKAIQNWKARRELEYQRRKQTQEEEAQKREEAKASTEVHRTEEEKRELDLRLEKWREERKKREERKEKHRIAEEVQRRKREKEERRRQMEVKLALEEQQKIRKEKEELEMRRRREEEQRAAEERRREAVKIIKQFNERDLQKVGAKVHEKQLKKKEEEEKQERIAAKLREKVDGHVSRDPSRLIRPTKGWQERMKHVGPSEKGPLLHIFHKAIPTWRQGL